MKCKFVFFNLSWRSMASPWTQLLEDQADMILPQSVLGYYRRNVRTK